jgi:hypothetical protein
MIYRCAHRWKEKSMLEIAGIDVQSFLMGLWVGLGAAVLLMDCIELRRDL